MRRGAVSSKLPRKSNVNGISTRALESEWTSYAKVDDARQAVAAAAVDELVADRRDKWSKQQAAPGVTLAYARGTGSQINLLRSPESGPWTVFTVPNSLREVEPNVKLIMDDGGLDEIKDQPPPNPPDSPDDEQPAAQGGQS